MEPRDVEPGPPASSRFTPEGDRAVEARIARDQKLVAAAVMESVPARYFRALVLIGGYARGEGGFRRDADGRPEPYNDYDYFVVVGGANAAEVRDLKPRLLQLGHALSYRVGVEVDLALLRAESLPKAEYSLMNAEMLWGHQVVAGDPKVLSTMPRMPFAELPLAEFTRLMLNRGSLLLMNREALSHEETDVPDARERFVKYLCKAVLACGDARLAAARRYHPSYMEKRERLERMRWPGHAGFLPLYETALEARFHPDRLRHEGGDLVDGLNEVTRLWLETLVYLESVRLGRGPGSWSEYASPAVSKGQSAPGLRGLARNVGVTLRDYGLLELLTNLRWSLRYPRERLISSLPGLLVGPELVSETHLSRALGLASGCGWNELTRNYLEQWHRYS